MPKKYTPAIFQANIRPQWGGIISYISQEEKSDILEAILKYPVETAIKSNFWFETIKPDLDMQHNQFIESCKAKGRGSKDYWINKDKDNISYPYGNLKDNYLKGNSKSNSKSNSKGKNNQDENQDENQEPNQVVDKDKDKDKEYKILFNEWYSKYPVKKSKPQAEKKFIQILKTKQSTVEELNAGLDNYLEDIKAKETETKYIAHPSTWLNQGRWADEYEEIDKPLDFNILKQHFKGI